MEYIDKSFTILALLGSVAVCSFLQRKNKPSNNPDVTISELWIYPIKSCKGIRVDRAEITPRGFDLDRLFMLADSTGKFVSQRSYPTMALIDVQVGTFEGAKLGRGRVLYVNAPGMSTLVIPTTKPSGPAVERTVTVWGTECQAEEVLSGQDKAWFSTFLKVPDLNLVRMKDDFVRQTDEKYTPDGQTAFADGFAFLLASDASLDRVNAQLKEPVTHARFRPNIIVRGGDAFDEDKWEKVRFHGVTYLRETTNKRGNNNNNNNNNNNINNNTLDMSVVKPCARCTIPNIDPECGVPDPDREPSRSMRSIRSGAAIGLANPKWQKDIFYGQNLDHSGQSGMILSVGERVEVLAATGPFLACQLNKLKALYSSLKNKNVA